jgi:predicted glycoside hydrolase/deacetylase ChbG (UPF0249 family)
MRRKVVLCADDFGLSPAVCEGILELAAAGRLTATGCMLTQPEVAEFARPLLAFHDKVDIGLHLVMTGQIPLHDRNGRLPPVGRLFSDCIKGRADGTTISREIRLQLDAFEGAFGCRPDFVDGHHHVQQYPVIRDLLLDELAERYEGNLPVLRCCDDRWSVILGRRVAVLKSLMLATLGRAFRGRAEARGFRMNDGFTGVYDLSGRVPYHDLFRQFVLGLRDGGLVMCHPGRVDDRLRAVDGLTDQRLAELDYLAGSGFSDLLQAEGIEPARFSAAAK